MGAPNEFTIDDVKAELKKIGDQVKEAGEKALAEAKKHGDMSAEMKPKVDELLVKQGELQARLLEVEQKERFFAQEIKTLHIGVAKPAELCIPAERIFFIRIEFKRQFSLQIDLVETQAFVKQKIILAIPGVDLELREVMEFKVYA